MTLSPNQEPGSSGWSRGMTMITVCQGIGGVCRASRPKSSGIGATPPGDGANVTACPGPVSGLWPSDGCPHHRACIHTLRRGLTPDTRGRSRMRQIRSYGSARGVPSNRHSYRIYGRTVNPFSGNPGRVTRRGLCSSTPPVRISCVFPISHSVVLICSVPDLQRRGLCRPRVLQERSNHG
jgi:hypothetical protein